MWWSCSPGSSAPRILRRRDRRERGAGMGRSPPPPRRRHGRRLARHRGPRRAGGRTVCSPTRSASAGGGSPLKSMTPSECSPSRGARPLGSGLVGQTASSPGSHFSSLAPAMWAATALMAMSSSQVPPVASAARVAALAATPANGSAMASATKQGPSASWATSPPAGGRVGAERDPVATGAGSPIAGDRVPRRWTLTTGPEEGLGDEPHVCQRSGVRPR